MSVLFIQTESQDYDGVAVWLDGDAENYAPLQLKELVPAKLNPNDRINTQSAADSANVVSQSPQ